MRQSGDVATSFILILIGIGVIVKSIGMHVGTATEPQTGFFPLLGGITLSILSLILLLQSLTGRSVGTKAFGNLSRPILIVVVMLIYTLLFEILGYVIVTLMLSIVVLCVLETKWWLAIGASLILTIASYILFDRLLAVSLPGGVLAKLFAG
jgi:putative tricarboxylic transport membrane protein